MDFKSPVLTMFGKVFATKKLRKLIIEINRKRYMSHTSKQHDDNRENDLKQDELNQSAENKQVDEVNADAETEEVSELESLKTLLQQKDEEVANEKKEYLFLMAEFDNFRKRTLRERTDLIKSASEKALKGLLPIIDDFERGLDAIREASDAESVKEGMQLIYNKLIKYLAENGVKAMESTGAQFDTELHEAVAMIPAASDEEKGIVKDTVSKGYTINDKVLRHAKVVVAQ
jgi:molecular chaperone GrpE